MYIRVIERRLDSNQVNWAEVSSSLFRDVYILKEGIISRINCLLPTPNTKFIFHKADYDNIIAHLDSISWETELSALPSVNDMVSRFYRILGETITRYVPLKRHISHKYYLILLVE
ncbi:hypothetical protein ACJJTC_005308 [Scirpophaga incertulas]